MIIVYILGFLFIVGAIISIVEWIKNNFVGILKFLIIGVLCIAGIRFVFSHTQLLIPLLIIAFIYLQVRKSNNKKKKDEVLFTLGRLGAANAQQISASTNINSRDVLNFLNKLVEENKIEQIPLKQGGTLYKSKNISGNESNFIQHTIEL